MTFGLVARHESPSGLRPRGEVEEELRALADEVFQLDMKRFSPGDRAATVEFMGSSESAPCFQIRSGVSPHRLVVKAGPAERDFCIETRWFVHGFQRGLSVFFLALPFLVIGMSIWSNTRWASGETGWTAGGTVIIASVFGVLGIFGVIGNGMLICSRASIARMRQAGESVRGILTAVE